MPLNFKLEKKTLRHQAYETLHYAITRGEVGPGERLNETDLANQFGISRTPTREALMQLERDGLVQIDPGKGAIVSEVSQSDLEEIYPILAVLESLAAERAATNLSRKDIATLKELNLQLKRIAAGKDRLTYLEVNDKFHRVFIDRCENQELCALIEEYKNRIYQFRVFYLNMAGTQQNSTKEHAEIITAFENEDSKLVGRLVKEHMEAAVKKLNEIFIG